MCVGLNTQSVLMSVLMCEYVGLSVCVYTRECAYMGVCGSSDHTHRSVCVFVCVPVSMNVHTYEHVGLSM